MQYITPATPTSKEERISILNFFAIESISKESRSGGVFIRRDSFTTNYYDKESISKESRSRGVF